MPIYVKRKNGEVTKLRNGHLLPAFYFIPKEILTRCGVEINKIPRNINKIITDRKMIKIVESDLFFLAVSDAFAYMVWPYMGFKEYMEVYSGDDPAWRLAHSPTPWVRQLQDKKFIPTVEELLEGQNDEDLSFLSLEQVNNILSVIVPQAMGRFKFRKIIQTAKKYRCHEDFDTRRSRKKIDFYRKWTHLRTKNPFISLEQVKEDYARTHDGEEWDVEDEDINVEKETIQNDYAETFLSTLDKVERKILILRWRDYSLEEIAEIIGLETHSAVIKRIRKIGKKYEKFAGVDLGFSDKYIVKR